MKVNTFLLYSHTLSHRHLVLIMPFCSGFVYFILLIWNIRKLSVKFAYSFKSLCLVCQRGSGNGRRGREEGSCHNQAERDQIFNLIASLKCPQDPLSLCSCRLHFDTGMLFKGLGTQEQFSTFILLECSLLLSTFAVHPAFMVC